MTRESANKADIIVACITEHGSMRDSDVSTHTHIVKQAVRDWAKKDPRLVCRPTDMIELAEKPVKADRPEFVSDLERQIWRHLERHGPMPLNQVAGELGHGQATVNEAVQASRCLAVDQEEYIHRVTQKH